jgi:DNA-binding transcriptional LysR family regulator
MHTPSSFDWSDLQYLLAVARHGSTLGASRAMGVNQSTVQRRLGELERCIGQPLVKRQPTGCRLTALGERLLPHARRVEEAALALQEQVNSARRDLTGVVRVTCPEPLVTRLGQSDLLKRFAAMYPGLQVEFVMTDKYLDLGRGEADIALRAGEGNDDTLVGRKICDSTWSVFASRQYAQRHGLPANVADLARHALVGLDDSMAHHRTAVWLRQVAPQAGYAARNNSVLGLVQSVRAGVGVSPLPDLLGEAEPDLVRAFGPVPELGRIWRILTTPDLRHSPRVEALFDFFAEEVDALGALLTKNQGS